MCNENSEQSKSILKKSGESLSKATNSVINTTKSVTVSAFDQDGDGVLDKEDLRILKEKGIALSKSASDKSGELIKKASKTTLAKHMVSGAAVGAVVAIPIPVVGPVAGAVVGAGLGFYGNVTGKFKSGDKPVNRDVYAEILKLGELKDKGLITEEEFTQKKRKLLEEL